MINLQRFFYVWLILFLSLPYLSQGQGQIQGRLLDELGAPVSYANVLLLHLSDSTLVEGKLPKATGHYQFVQINSGSYFLQVSMLGYQTWNSSPIKIGSSQDIIDLGTHILKENTVQLEGVVIEGEKNVLERKIDRTILNIENSVLAKGGTALQVLERSPGVVIDYRNNQLALNGSSGVLVMLNGKPLRIPQSELLTMLQGMTSDNIEKVELIDTPPAKYDADGSAGIINIVLKKPSELGTQATLSITGGFGWAEKAASSLTINRQQGKSNFYGTYSYLRDGAYYQWDAASTQNMPDLGGELAVTFLNRTANHQNNHQIRLGLDHNVSKQTILGGSTNFNWSQNHIAPFSQGNYLQEPDSLLVMKSQVSSRIQWKNILSNVYLEHQFKNKSKINIDVDYLFYQNKTPSIVNSHFFDQLENEVQPGGEIFHNEQRGISNTTIKIAVAGLAYEYQFHPNIKLEAGLKGTSTITTNQGQLERFVSDFWELDPRTISKIHMTENIGAAYTSLQIQIDSTSQLIAGARYEYTHRQLEEENTQRVNQRGRLFPSLLFSKRLSEKSEIQLAYSKRINRPAYNDLASYLIYIDPIAVATGNPLLRPILTNTLKIGYNYNGYSFALVMSRETNPIVRFQLAQNPEGDLLYLSPQNLTFQNNLNLQVNIPWQITDWWSTNQGFTSGWRQFRVVHTPEPITKTYFAYNLYGNQVFNLPAGFSIELSGWYNSGHFNGSIQVDGFGQVNGGIKKQFGKNKGTLQLSVLDLFKSLRITSRPGGLTQEVFELEGSVYFKAESAVSRIFRLSYIKSFGGQSSGQSKRKSRSAEERERVRQE